MPIDTIPVSPWMRTAEQIVEQLDSNASTGISNDEARSRLEQFGPNQLHEGAQRGPFLLFLSQFLDLMIALLGAAAVISFIIGDWQDSVLILLIVLANAAVGSVQEWRAEQAIAALKKLSQPSAHVVRNGRMASIAAHELVPGDIIELHRGDLLQADGRLIEAANLQTDESALTGESLSVDKSPAPVEEQASLPERTCMVYSGTAVTLGRGRALVVGTGMETELGRVAALLATTERSQTPLQRRLAVLSKRLAIIVLLVCVVVFVLGVVRKPMSEWNTMLFKDMLLVAVSLAVAAIPEGLPAVITVALALGSQKMARRKAVIRRLSAVETLGSVNVICSDKTGTLTQNRMVVDKVLPFADNEQATEALLRAGSLCNDADISEKGELIGSPTEVAILTAGSERGIDPKSLRQQWQRLDEVPFDSTKKRMFTLNRAPDGGRWIFAKGAAEAIVECSSHLGDGDHPLDEQGRSHWRKMAEELAEQGRRVLAAATCPWNEDHLPGDACAGLHLLGLFAIVDPPRPEARESIARCRSAGIRPVMITGDHPGTARAISEELELWQEGDEVLAGNELDRLDQPTLEKRVPHVSVFARVSPEHKLRIVQALKVHGWVVAMTGDGVNDAPALKQADIGVAMGITGTDVAKESADMVLADDNFATIVVAVEEGRVVYDNIRRFVRYLLTTNSAEIMVVLFSMLITLPLPLLPVHILWINLVTDGLPALALGFELPESGVMRRRPRPRDETLFAHGLGRQIILMGLFMAVLCVALFAAYNNGWLGSEARAAEGSRLAYARSMVFLVLSMSQLFYVLSLRSSTQTFFELGLFSNYRLTGAVLVGSVLQLAILYVPSFQTFFRTRAPSLTDLCIGLAVAAMPLAVAEASKVIQRIKKPTNVPSIV